MIVNNIKSKSIIFYIFFNISCFLFIVLFFNYKLSLHTAQILIIFIFGLCFFISTRFNNFNVFQIFLVMMFLFNIALPIFVQFGLFKYPIGNKILFGDGINSNISDEILTETYVVLAIMLLGSSVGWLTGLYRSRLKLYKNSYYNIKNKNIDYTLFKYIFYVLFTLVIYKNLKLVYYSSIYGYVEVMHLHSIDLEIHFILIVSDILFKVSGFSMLYISKYKKEFIFFSILFMIPYLIQIATGARGETIAILLTIIFLYTTYYEQINIKKLFSIAIIILVAITLFGTYRYNRDVSTLISNFSLTTILIAGIVSNSSSIGVLSYTIKLKDQFFNDIPFFFGYIQGIFSFAPNYTLEGIYSKNYLAQHITFLMNPTKLYSGSTIGTSMAAEFYELTSGNLFLIFILSFFLLYFAIILINNLHKNIYLFFIGSIYFESLWLSPRGSIMKLFSKESVISIFFILFVILTTRTLNKYKGKFNTKSQYIYK